MTGGIIGPLIATGPGIVGIGAPKIGPAGGGVGATPTPGTASPRTARGPYFATTSPNLPYAMRKKKAGSRSKIVGYRTVGLTRIPKVGIMKSMAQNSVPPRARAYLPFAIALAVWK